MARSRWPRLTGRGRAGGVDPGRATLELMRTAGKSRLQRLAEGSEAALGELMAEYWGPLAGYANRMLGCEDAADDVVQETFVRLWSARETLHTRGSERGLVYEIARNLTLKRIRHLAVRRRTEPEVRQALVRTIASPLEQAITTERQCAMEQALDLLPGRRKEAFVLLRCQGLSLREAAEVMGLSTQTVANHAVLALKQLRQILQRYQDG